MSPVNSWRIREHKERIVDPWKRTLAKRVQELQAKPGITLIVIRPGWDDNTWSLEWTERVRERENA